MTRVFFDGACGLCHGFVRFAVKRDRRARLRFAPLQGATAGDCIEPEVRAGLPDSVVALTGGGRLLTRSDAVLHVLREIGGIWRPAASVLAVAPRPLRDWVYERLAASRKRLFRAPEAACPVVPAELARRFDP